MESKLRVSYSSDSKYKYMTAEIRYDGKIICQISQDNGVGDSMDIEFFHAYYRGKVEPRMKFSLGEFLSVIEYVKKCLPDYRVEI